MSFLSKGLALKDDLVEEEKKVGDSRSQTQVLKKKPKFLFNLGNLPNKVDYKMILTLSREFIA